MKLQKILLSRIDAETEGWDKYLFDTSPKHVDRLAVSFQRVGQIYPLLLLKDMQWMFMISGYAKYMAMMKLGIDEAWARIFQKNEISDEMLLWLSVEEKCGRIWSRTAQRNALKKFHNIVKYPVERLASEVAPAIGLDSSVELVKTILAEDS